VVDFEKFTSKTTSSNKEGESVVKKSELLPGFLTIVEEMPGMMVSHDQTDHLREHSYWASYNIPFYSDLSLYSNNTQLCQTQRNVYLYQNQTLEGVDASSNSASENKRLGNANCYSTCARARLFSRLHTDIHDIPSALKVMSHNDYLHDQEAYGNPCEEIACREDLQPLDENLNVFGAIDTKLSSVLEADTVYRRHDQHQGVGGVGAEVGTEQPLLSGAATVLAGQPPSPPLKSSDLIHLAPQPLVFPLPLVVPSIVDISTAGAGAGADGEAVTMQSANPSAAAASVIEASFFSPFPFASSPYWYKQPRVFARQGPTHGEGNAPFCWSDFEARHDAWVAAKKATAVTGNGGVSPAAGSRRLREEKDSGNKEMWRKRKPAFRY
jgi:hypothetical protein